VSGDIEAIRAELTTDDAEPCLDQVDYSTQQLEAAQQAIQAQWQDLYIGSTGSGNAYNRVTVDLFVADAAAVRQVAALVEDPDMLIVFGTATITAGT
jgi:hypothetical protein